MKPDEATLIPLLREAARRFATMGHQDIWDSDDYTDDLGRICSEAADYLEQGLLDDEIATRLYFMFAPTCEWDNSIGDVSLGNSIFTLLNRLYRHIALKE